MKTFQSFHRNIATWHEDNTNNMISAGITACLLFFALAYLVVTLFPAT